MKLRVIASVLITGLNLSLCCSVVFAQVSSGAIEAIRDNNFNIAIELLEPQKSEPGAMRWLAFAFIRNKQFEQIHNSLSDALRSAPIDGAPTNEELSIALLNEARNSLGDEKTDEQVTKALEFLVQKADPHVSTLAADTLIQAYLEDENLDQAYKIAQISLKRDPNSIYKYRFERLRPNQQKENNKLEYDLGYRLEYDDNITFPDELLATNQGDFRHVLMADILYDRSLNDRLRMYAQGHFLQSFHHDLSQFNQTRITGSVALGQSGQNVGWRLPLELSHDRLDGDSFRTSVATIPGVYVQLGANSYSHFYARFQKNDYDIFQSDNEDRSGDAIGIGALFVGQVSPRLQLRSYVEFNRHDTDGLYWKRDETIAFIFGEFEFSNDWVAGLAFRYVKEDYDNARPVFAERQSDEAKELYINLTHNFNDHWRSRGQISLIDHGSNIAIFDYDRNVYSISVIWEF